MKEFSQRGMQSRQVSSHSDCAQLPLRVRWLRSADGSLASMLMVEQPDHLQLLKANRHRLLTHTKRSRKG